jgi:hypothetical protein
MAIEAELLAAGWESADSHIWISPVDGKCYHALIALEMARNGVRAEDPTIAEFKRAAREAAKYSTKKGTP